MKSCSVCTFLEVVLMKIVVVKSPKVISGLLRMIFKIKKEENDC